MRLQDASCVAVTLLLGGISIAFAGAVDVAAYDAGLCERAQRMIVNADGPVAPAFHVKVLIGEANGFHTIQMDVDAASHETAAAMQYITVREAAYVLKVTTIRVRQLA